jgi:hypothetical protein
VIAECLIFLYTLVPVEQNLTFNFIDQYRQCNQIISDEIKEHADILIEYFGEDHKQLSTAVKVIWCESRGVETAVRTAEGNYDTGLFQFVSWTWNWVAEKYDLPMWNEWVVMKNDRPYTDQVVSKTSYGFTFQKAQYTEYFNIKFGYLLSQDIYGRSQWKDWSSSEWCWGNTQSWIKKVKQERN